MSVPTGTFQVDIVVVSNADPATAAAGVVTAINGYATYNNTLPNVISYSLVVNAAGDGYVATSLFTYQTP